MPTAPETWRPEEVNPCLPSETQEGFPENMVLTWSLVEFVKLGQIGKQGKMCQDQGPASRQTNVKRDEVELNTMMGGSTVCLEMADLPR